MLQYFSKLSSLKEPALIIEYEDLPGKDSHGAKNQSWHWQASTGTLTPVWSRLPDDIPDSCSDTLKICVQHSYPQSMALRNGHSQVSREGISKPFNKQQAFCMSPTYLTSDPQRTQTLNPSLESLFVSHKRTFRSCSFLPPPPRRPQCFSTYTAHEQNPKMGVSTPPSNLASNSPLSFLETQD